MALFLLACIAIIHATFGEASLAGRQLLADPVLPLPVDTSVCIKPALHELTKQFRSCAKAFLSQDNPDEDCCRGLAAFWGPNSTLPSRNCFCAKAVWEEFKAYEEQHYYSFKDAFLMCSNKGFIVPFYDETEEGEPTGFCYGAPPDAETMAAAIVKDQVGPDHVTPRAWMDKLRYDNLVTISFATGVMSGVGSLLLVWILLWDGALSGWGALKHLTSGAKA